MGKKVLVFCNPVIDASCFVSDAFLKKHGLEKDKIHVLSRAKIDSMTEEMKVATRTCGGSGMNIARWMGFMGSNVSVVGQLGNDGKNRETVEKALSECGVKNRLIIKEASMTTMVYVCITPDAKRTMFCVYGAAQEPHDAPLDEKLIDEHDVFLFEGFQFEVKKVYKNIIPMLEKAYAANKTNVFAISNIFAIPDYRSAVNAIKDKVHILTGTSEEFSILFGIQNLEKLLTFLENSSYELCAVTLGAEGCYLIHQGKRIFVPPPQVEKVVDTTGAGDGFTAGLIHGYLSGFSIEDCSKLANFCAGKTISKVGVVMDEALKKDLRECCYNIRP